MERNRSGIEPVWDEEAQREAANERRQARCRRYRRAAAAVALGLGLAASASANPPLLNPSFETVGVDGPSTVNTTAASGGAGHSAALGWGVFHNSAPATTRTDHLPSTLPGAGFRMICVRTDAASNGINQVTGPPFSGPLQGIGSAWVYVTTGTVGMGTGDHGTTGIDIQTTTTGVWEYLQAPNTLMPFNQMLFYATGGPADYCVEEAHMLELQDLTPWVPLEYSNALDEQAIPGGGAHGALDSGQILYTEPVDGAADLRPDDVHDFAPAIEEFEPDFQIDALANRGDGGFQDLLADAAPLLISLEGDPALVTLPIAVFREDIDGFVGPHYSQRDLHAADTTAQLEDLDALEMWGDTGDPLAPQDSDYYSLAFDFGASIWFDDGTGPFVYLTPSDILGALSHLGFDGSPGDVDVDALMVQDTGVVPGLWDEGDAVLFSIRPANGWDGGEIVHWEFGQAAEFLEHGGHAWDTAFDVAGTYGVDVDNENVDALETIPVPEPGLLAGLASGFGLLGSLDRRLRRRCTPIEQS